MDLSSDRILNDDDDNDTHTHTHTHFDIFRLATSKQPAKRQNFEKINEGSDR